MNNKNDIPDERTVLLDLETGQSGKILKIGAVRGVRTLLYKGNFNQENALAALDRFATESHCLIGHNLLRHDLPLLAEEQPELKLLRIPAVDTLLLSPICFPENPYHRLVKDYKLVSESINDPVADSKLAGVLFKDEIESLSGMAQTVPDVFLCLRFLLCGSFDDESPLAAGMRFVFATCGHPPSREDAPGARDRLSRVLQDYACRSCSMMISETDFSTEKARWALAYVLTWLRVAGSDSVLPPWVRLNNHLVAPLLSRLRDIPCDDPACEYCTKTHNPETQLKQYFGFDGFRTTPSDAAGLSLQRAIVVAGMRNESLLAIMPTGGGKSLCFQLPALIRAYRRGQLTVVVSPLQALMKDQVDGLVRRTGMNNAAALSGLLTPPERGEVLRGIRTGRIGLLYVSPEQLRSKAFRNAVSQREIGCWVMDEAHCLSKWGHDFRPDYMYAGRFIRELSDASGGNRPSIACFTATAKKDVISEIIEFFRRETSTELACYEGGVERDNLHFEVQTIGAHGKLPRIHDLLETRLSNDGRGSAVVFRTLRQDAEETALFLKDKGWSAACFHAGLQISEKKRIQNAFLEGEIRVICATCAFGMGIDKEDVRLVIHGDSPGSLESYLQEAGRAGRDRNAADCVLLYDEEDTEKQFRLGARSSLSRRDIAQILRGLRKAARQHKSDEIVITAGELLRDEDVSTDFDAKDMMADTKVRTAISWLERVGFVERNENNTNVFQGRLLVKGMEEAEKKLAGLALSEREQSLWMAVIREMINANETDMLSVDDIALLPEFRSYMSWSGTGDNDSSIKPMVRENRSQEYVSAKIFKVLDGMMSANLLKKDTLLTAYLDYKIKNHSGLRLARVIQVDRELIKILSEEEPDPEGWMPLNLLLINDALITRGVDCSPEMLRGLLQSLSEDGRGFAGQGGSIDLRHVGRDLYRVRVRREWSQITELAKRRNDVAQRLLGALFDSVSPETPPKGELLVTFSFEMLQSALEKDLALRSDIRDMQAAIERGLMFLHEQAVITLQKGLAIFRSAMTIRIIPESDKQRYSAEHYDALQHHYNERIFQVHVMNEYARYGIAKIREALDLVVAYFTMDKEAFIRRFFNESRELLDRATTARSYRTIVDALGNRDQIRIVTQPVSKNLLILAGPGSGKTRTVVHRCAYLLRVKRVRPNAVLVCCFNHKAALELRRRLAALVGRDAVGVTIQTYHGLALRILGLSSKGFAERNGAAPDFDRLITDAVAVLRGEKEIPGIAPDDVRDRLLSGFEHILVDEYQDIDDSQYEMIGAIAGRTLSDRERKLSILAVGDDDQSIYGFRGANIEFIRRFHEDYTADVAYLVENYRSSRYIIEAVNRMIAHNRDRMKTEHEIRIDQGRSMLPAGGVFGDKDGLTRGRVAVVEITDATSQAGAVVRELIRLRALGSPDWDNMAVLSRTRRDLALIRTAAEEEGIPINWPLERNKIPPLHRIREIADVLEALAAERKTTVCASDLLARFDRSSVSNEITTPWQNLLSRLLVAWKDETADEPTPLVACAEFLYEALAQRRHEEQFGDGVTLATVHSAKGMEYPHVLLCGDWSGSERGMLEDERRVIYVGMTRAKDTLSIFVRKDVPNPFVPSLSGPAFAQRRETSTRPGIEECIRDYTQLGLGDIYLDYAGRQDIGNPVHTALARLKTGSTLQIRKQNDRVHLLTDDGCSVAQLSTSAAEIWGQRIHDVEQVRVLCMLRRFASDSKEEYRDAIKVDRWEIPMCELVVRPQLQPSSL